MTRLVDAFEARRPSPLLGRALSAPLHGAGLDGAEGLEPGPAPEEEGHERAVCRPLPVRRRARSGACRARRPAEVEAAVAKAAEVFETTRKLPTYGRVGILRRVADDARAQKDELARTIALEAGKPLKAARAEVERAAGTFAAAAAAVETGTGDSFRST